MNKTEKKHLLDATSDPRITKDLRNELDIMLYKTFPP